MRDFWNFVFDEDGWGYDHPFATTFMIMVGALIAGAIFGLSLIVLFNLVGLYIFYGTFILAALYLGPYRLIRDYRRANHG